MRRAAPGKIRRLDSLLAGWAALVGSMVFAVWWDPWGVFHPEPFHDVPLWLVATGCMCVLGLFFSTFASRPYVVVDGGVLVVQNPLRRWRLPLHEVELVEDGFPYAKVRFRGRSVSSVAAEQVVQPLSSYGLGLERRVSRSVLVGRSATVEEQVPGDAAVSVRPYEWSRPDGVQVVAGVFWTLYFFTGLMAAGR